MSSLASRPSRVDARQLYLLCVFFLSLFLSLLFFVCRPYRRPVCISIITRKIPARQVRGFFSLYPWERKADRCIAASSINFSMKAPTVKTRCRHRRSLKERLCSMFARRSSAHKTSIVIIVGNLSATRRAVLSLSLFLHRRSFPERYRKRYVYTRSLLMRCAFTFFHNRFAVNLRYSNLP